MDKDLFGGGSFGEEMVLTGAAVGHQKGDRRIRMCSYGKRCQRHVLLPRSFRRGQKAESTYGDFQILK